MAARRTRARIEVSEDRGVFMISVAAELADMHPQTLRMYEARGLIAPLRSPKGTRLYSQADVERLRRIQEMTADLGLNLAGVERVLELELEVERLRAKLDAMQRRAEFERAETTAELERLSGLAQAEVARARAARGEVVLYQPGGEIVHVQRRRRA
jgi:MerR family transcriptional regulator/heat shock protein HspR